MTHVGHADTLAAMWLTDDEVRAHSSGEVRSPESYGYLTYLPEKGGLYCELIFGPVTWERGDLHGMPRDDRRERCGHLMLPEPVPRREGPPRRVILVVPPAWRCFRLLTAEEHRAHARARRAELLRLAEGDAWPYSDPLGKVLAEEGLDDPDAIEAMGEGVLEPALNEAYRAVVNRARMLGRLGELGAPASVLDGPRASLASACDRLDVELRRSEGLPEAVRRAALGLRGG